MWFERIVMCLKICYFKIFIMWGYYVVWIWNEEKIVFGENKIWIVLNKL